MTRCYIGCHASISKGILNAIKYVEDIDGNALQIFLGSNQSTSLNRKTKVSEYDILEINNYVKENNIKLFIHTVYLLNFCNFPPDNKRIKYALDNLIFDLNLTEKLGGLGCVLHIGYQKDLEEHLAYHNMVENVKYAIDQTKGLKVKILLETPAGRGSQICTSLDEFVKLWKMFPKKYLSRLGTCIDTAHIFSSGRCISSVSEIKKYLSEFDKKVGISYLDLFHINDSKAICNSRKDLHEGIGKGYIYKKELGGDLEALKEIWKFCKKNKIPMVLETHSGGYYNMEKDNGMYSQEIKLFRDWDYNLNPKFKLIPGKYILKSKKTLKKKKTFNNNKLIIGIFSKLSKYYKDNNDTIRSNSYELVVNELKKLDKDIENSKEVKDIKGFGKKMLSKIDEIIKTKHLKYLDTLEFDDSNLDKVLGIGVEKKKSLKKKKINTIDNLVENIGKAGLNYQQKIGLEYHKELERKISRKDALLLKNKIKRIIDLTDLNCLVEIGGSFTDKNIKESKDIDILITSHKYKKKDDLLESYLLKEIINLLKDKNIITHILSLGKTKFLGLCIYKDIHRHLDIRLMNKNSYIFSKLYYTSGKMFNKMIRGVAKKKGYKLNEWGLFRKDKIIKIENEKELFKILELDFVKLENRR